MEQIIITRDVRPRLRSIAPFLLVLLCAFKPAQHPHYTLQTLPAPSWAVCERVETALPGYDIPRLIEHAACGVASPTAPFACPPPYGDPLRAIERSFSLSAARRPTLFDGRSAPVRGADMLRRSSPESSDEPPSPLLFA